MSSSGSSNILNGVGTAGDAWLGSWSAEDWAESKAVLS